MKRLLSVILACLLFSACSSNKPADRLVENNKAVKTLGIEMKEGAVGAFLNNFDSDVNIRDVKVYDSMEENSEKGLIVPFYSNSKIKIETVEYDLKTLSLVPKKEVFSDVSTDDYATYIIFNRPEGIPNLRISIEHEGRKSLFLLSYNGKEESPDIQYIGNLDIK